VLDRPSILRDRCRVTLLKLHELGGTSFDMPLSVNDIHRAMLVLWEDAAEVTVRELVESMLAPGTLLNGGGSFNFVTQDDGVLASWSP
jgi:hypothetical protein